MSILGKQALPDAAPYRHSHQKRDGRTVHLYSWQPLAVTAMPEPEPPPTEAASPEKSHMRWHPVRKEWVVYSAARQNRTFKPPAEYCPLCPTKKDSFPGEIPFSSFDIAVFDNKFPAFSAANIAAPALGITSALPANGKCEVVVFCAEHEGSVASLPDDRVELLLEVWIDRYRDLRGKDGIAFVMPFENRGEEAGVTLHHPHGQIYGFPFVPPLLQNYVEAFKEKRFITDLLEKHGDRYAVFRDEFVTAFVPPFARFPFEIWIAANRSIPGPWAFTPEEKTSFARTLKKTIALYDGFFGRVSPYIYVMHAAPEGADGTFEFSAQFYPLLRSPQKLKYLAGCEQGTNVFLNDVLPEEAVDQLREFMKGRP